MEERCEHINWPNGLEQLNIMCGVIERKWRWESGKMLSEPALRAKPVVGATAAGRNLFYLLLVKRLWEEVISDFGKNCSPRCVGGSRAGRRGGRAPIAGHGAPSSDRRSAPAGGTAQGWGWGCAPLPSDAVRDLVVRGMRSMKAWKQLFPPGKSAFRRMPAVSPQWLRSDN